MNIMEEKRTEVCRGAAARYEGRANSVFVENIYCEYLPFLRLVEEYHHWLLEARDLMSQSCKVRSDEFYGRL